MEHHESVRETMDEVCYCLILECPASQRTNNDGLVNLVFCITAAKDVQIQPL